jgi:pimeloyl-ACP methyl ester carboxylesterase
MSNTKTVHVAHLGGIDAGYQMPHPYDPSKPTLVLVNSFTTSSELYQGQYANKQLTDKMNLLAIELLGHGKTRTKSENFTYWDTAIMNLQVMEALGVKKAFVLGTSQGGWITVRMALLAPDKVSCSIVEDPHLESEYDLPRRGFHLTISPRSKASSPLGPPWTMSLNARESSDAGMASRPAQAPSMPGQPTSQLPVSSPISITATS